MLLQRLSALFLVIFFFIYLVKVGEVFNLGFLPSILSFVLAFLSLMLSYRVLYKKNHIDLVVFFYAIILVFSAIHGPDISTALRYLAQIATYSIAPYLLFRTINVDEVLVTRFRRYSLLIFVPLSAWVYFSLGAGGLFHNFRLGNNDFNPVAVGYLLGFFVLAVFFELLHESNGKHVKFCYTLLLLLILVLLTLTGSRGPLISVVIVCILSTTISKFSFSKLLFTIAVIGVICFIMFKLFVDSEGASRFTNPLNSASALERFNEWQHALLYFEQNPVFGLGLGGFDIIYGNYPHNVFLEHASNTGITGLIAYAVLAVLTIIFFVYENSNSNSNSVELRFLVSGLVYAFSVRLLSLNMANSKEIFLFLALYITLSMTKAKPYVDEHPLNSK